MEVFFFRPDIYERYYNCSAYQVDSIPLEKRSREWLGVFFFSVATIYQVCLTILKW
jgi:hypothetical protein